MKTVYAIYEDDQYNTQANCIALVSSKKKAIAYCSQDGRKIIHPLRKDKQHIYGKTGTPGYFYDILYYEEKTVI